MLFNSAECGANLDTQKEAHAGGVGGAGARTGGARRGGVVERRTGRAEEAPVGSGGSLFVGLTSLRHRTPQLGLGRYPRYHNHQQQQRRDRQPQR